MTSAHFVSGNKDWKLLEMCADEIPNTVFSAGRKFESFLQAAVWLVSGYDQVFADCVCVELFLGQHPFVENTDISDDKPSYSQSFLDGRPDGIL